MHKSFWALLVGLIFATAPATADQRVALVIGNSGYKHASPLKNPLNDAADIATALKSFGFEVIMGLDLEKAGLEAKIRQFANSLKGADSGVFFYAGHGLQMSGQNLLIPVDAKLEDASGIDFETVRLDLIQRIMEREAKTSILFLDACRDNPLARSLARAMGTRSADVRRGLAPTESGVGTLISFSTQPGNVALDGAGRNSPFAGALAKQLSTSKDDLGAILIAVRNEVMQASNNQQVPWEHSSLRSRFYFSLANATTGPQDQSLPSEVAQRWAEIKDSDDAALLTAFRLQYGTRNPLYDHLAQKRLDALKISEKSEIEPKRIDRQQAAELLRRIFGIVRDNYPERPDEPQLLSRAVGRLLDRYPGTFDKSELTAKIGTLDAAQPNSTADLLAEIFESLQQQHGRKAEPEILLESMTNAVLRGLDAQSYYVRPERNRAVQVTTKGEFGGIGIEIRMENGLAKVIAPLDDTPAAKADLRAGDLIAQIDGRPIAGLTLEQVVARLRGPVRTSVTLAIQRKGVERPIQHDIIRDVIRIKAVKSRLESDVIYIKITTFNEQARPNVRSAIEELKRAAGDRLKGYILDLRNNSGGLLDVATAIADDFLESGTIVSTKGRGKNATLLRVAQPGDLAEGKPMVVLVNAGTASGAEIVTAALQENRRALVIGVRTLGKGSIQTIFPFGDQGALRLTTSHFFTPLNRELETVGVSPDIVIEQEAAGAGRDAPLEAALARLRSGRAK